MIIEFYHHIVNSRLVSVSDVIWPKICC